MVEFGSLSEIWGPASHLGCKDMGSHKTLVPKVIINYSSTLSNNLYPLVIPPICPHLVVFPPYLSRLAPWLPTPSSWAHLPLLLPFPSSPPPHSHSWPPLPSSRAQSPPWFSAAYGMKSRLPHVPSKGLQDLGPGNLFCFLSPQSTPSTLLLHPHRALISPGPSTPSRAAGCCRSPCIGAHILNTGSQVQRHLLGATLYTPPLTTLKVLNRESSINVPLTPG